MQRLIDEIFSLSEEIRYIAIYRDRELLSSMKPGFQNASTSESDKYEELIVNPTILTLVRQRGDIDCGGCQFVLIRYGNFFQFVTPVGGGHISVCLSLGSDALKLGGEIYEVIQTSSAA
jgi:hypothetical protein